MSKLVVKLSFRNNNNTRRSAKSNETANKTAKAAISSKERTQKIKNKLKIDPQNLHFFIQIFFLFCICATETNYGSLVSKQ